MKNNIDWNDCAPEILCMVFKYLDTKALTKCMWVNKKWKDIAEHTAEYYKLWEKIVKNEMINNGTTFKNKSILDWRNIYKNSLLWSHVAKCSIKHLKTYNMQDVKKINIYKDNLILVTNSHVLYYDVKTFTLIRSIETSCLNLEENDNMVVELTQSNDMTLAIYFYMKQNINDISMDISKVHVMNDIKMYRLEDSCCYVLIATKNILLEVTHKDSLWKINFLYRHYGSDYDPIAAIHVCNDSLYLMTKLGTVWYGDPKKFTLAKMYNLTLPDEVLVKQFNWVLFDTYSCVVPLSNSTYETMRVAVTYDAKSDVTILKCSGLTCALQHGNVLLLGYNDGTVEIRIPSKYKSQNRSEPERYFNIQQYFDQTEDCTIVGLNVCETVNSHLLLVSTKDHVFQLHLAYPESVLLQN